MRFTPRFLISFLAGVGGGTVGFAVAWACDQRYLSLENGPTRDAYFFAGIFVPAFITLVAVFRTLGGTTSREYPFDE